MLGIQIEMPTGSPPTEWWAKNRLDRTLIWTVPLVASAIGCTLWWLHAVLNDLHPPNDTPMDDAIYAIVSICKLAVIITMPFLIALICKLLYRDRRIVVRCVILWLVALAILITALVVNHDRLAEMLNNEVMRYQCISNASPAAMWDYVDREVWLQRWHSGQIIGLEVLFGLVFITVLSGVAYKLSAKTGVATGLAVALLVLTIAWPIVFGLWVSDYDEFLGGIYTDSVAVDLTVPIVAMDPPTEVTMTVFLFFTLSTVLGIWPKLWAR
jgi:hypothetical protein